MTPLKILSIITRLEMGGSAASVIDLCQKINHNKYYPILLYGGDKKTDYDLSAIKNLYHIKHLTRNISVLKDVAAFFSILKWIIKENPNIVHTFTSKAGILGVWAAFIARGLRLVRKELKIVHSAHGHIFYGYYSPLCTKFFAIIVGLTSRLTDCLIALTDGEKTETTTIAGLPKGVRWEIIPSGINISDSGTSIPKSAILKEFGIPTDSIVIGTVARLEPVKGVIYFVKATELIMKKISQNVPQIKDKIYFLIVGDGSLKKELESLSKTLAISTNRVIFTGMRQDVENLISVMDIYVQPSLNEGLGKTIAEAMSKSKPIVATNVQGIPDLIKDGKTGILVAPADENAISDAVIKLILTPELSKFLGENARKFVTEKIDGYQRFSIERMIYLHEKLYDELTT